MTKQLVDTFLKIKEANKVFKVGMNTLYGAVGNGEIPHYRPGGTTILVKAVDVQDWVEKHPGKTKLTREEIREMRA